MMLMNVFDMGFGESILLKSDNASLLVDCGSKTKRNVELQVSSIRSNINKHGSINFMLTHFHKDHFNGFERLVQGNHQYQADVVYIPWINFNKGEAILLDIAVYLYLLYTKQDTDVSFLLKNQIYFILECVKEDGLVYALKRNDCFEFSGRDMEVLWPKKVELIEASNHKLDKVKQITREILDTLFPTEEQQDNFNSLKDDIENTLKEFYGLFKEKDKKLGIQLNEKTRNKLKDWCIRQKKLLNKIDKKRKDTLKDKKEDVKKWRKQLKEIFNDDTNACSIVFRDKQRSNLSEYNLLMTGDITKRVIEKYLYDSDFKNKRYKYMKCPHHGTCTHYTVCLPRCDHFIISNGPYKRYHAISAQYFYHPCVMGIRYCTNAHCEIIQSGRSCREHNLDSCSHGSLSITIPEL